MMWLMVDGDRGGGPVPAKVHNNTGPGSQANFSCARLSQDMYKKAVGGHKLQKNADR